MRSAVVWSRLPVGSSANNSTGALHERPGQGRPLLLAAGEFARPMLKPPGEADAFQKHRGPAGLSPRSRDHRRWPAAARSPAREHCGKR